MRFHSMSFAAAGLAVALIASPEMVKADPLLNTSSATQDATEGDPGMDSLSQTFSVEIDTGLEAPFFPAVTVTPIATPIGPTSLAAGDSNYEDSLTPIFSVLVGGSFPLELYRIQGVAAAPEPSLLLVSAAALLVIAWRSRKPARR